MSARHRGAFVGRSRLSANLPTLPVARSSPPGEDSGDVSAFQSSEPRDTFPGVHPIGRWKRGVQERAARCRTTSPFVSFHVHSYVSQTVKTNAFLFALPVTAP